MPEQWLYANSRDNSARFILGKPGERPLVCIGVNPSTAEPENLDPTLKNVRKFSMLNGYDGWIMLNLYPQRTTNPNGLHEKLNRKLHQQNLKAIRKCLKEYDSVDIWAAWGTLINKRTYLSKALTDIVSQLDKPASRWVTIGPRSKAGHPHHPLYLAHRSAMHDFDVYDYCQQL